MGTTGKHLENRIASEPLAVRKDNQDQLPVLDGENPETITLNPLKVSKLMGISVSGAYDLMAKPGFPSFRIGRLWFVTIEAFQQWVKDQENIRK